MDEIRTERLVLRRARADDLGAIHAILSDREVMRYWSSEPHPDLETSRQWLESMINAPKSESDDFIITLDGVVIGKLGMWRTPEIGYILSRNAWGRGYAFEAGKAFLQYIFARGLTHAIADVDPRNTASLALLKRLGFTETGRAEKNIFINNEWCDSVYLRLDAPLGI
ncbi:GNAT family N-acetyltransferase [Phyllobacterium sp. 628]|uniref:GNAT family N-acetyltransferase n=1 Tax=Phyllobacterium sp. 628 TaxID=2718938 RepID=UPI0016626692|nr:GNAT family N-acetyltransferase [Phyllobacterium sp. 628]QND53200.1 GNAT family N-acetyltransferase [Phyllobacterium sp. 628]